MSVKNKLNRLKSHISGTNQPLKAGNNSEISREQNTGENQTDIPFLDQWTKEGVKPYFLDNDFCLIREVRYPLNQHHGHYQFSDFIKAVEVWNKATISHPLSAKGHSPEELFFFDTETTGLGGGTGNTIFLLGYASVQGTEIVLRQHILPHPGAEVALYKSFLESVNYKTLVTYNGKSFDWPQVKTRHTLVREHVPKLPSFGHFDLYHASRRLWKHKLEKMKLSIVEKEVLGVERVNDIPGYLAPMIYFDYVESKQPEGMLGILKHNEIDILSLISLYVHLTFQLCGLDKERTRIESFEVGRWLASIGEREEADKVFELLALGKDSASNSARLALAYSKKKELNWEKALELFLEVADSETSSDSLKACIEAAKIYEHKEKNYQFALSYCRKADAIDLVIKSDNKSFRNELQKRILRLEKKQMNISRNERL
ncbi:MAG: ribonuclease H-like domain-containing protein [Bacillota bacterium]|nr:ribonuclease H-like domain-containing protein [Bacillota bacterium]MDP4171987.1 ribonuclease H-like domain-containing protein [Bacillota bacterium]